MTHQLLTFLQLARYGRQGVVALVAVLTFCFFQPNIAMAKVAITHSSSLPAGRTNTPIPTDANVVFYIQRSMNKNTVVYQAQLDENGKLAAKAPLKAFWRRFAGRGNKRGLKFFERKMAYGVSTSKKAPGQYSVKFAAYSKRHPILKLDKNGHPMLYERIGKREYKLIFAYVHLRSGGPIPDIAYVDIVGQDIATGSYTRARVHNPLRFSGRKLGRN